MGDLVIEGCAGPGGWSTGLRWAGYDGYAVGIEWDRDACRTAVTAGHLRIQADIATYPLSHLAGKVTGLILSPPCPSWSSAGDGAGKIDLPNVLRLIDDFAASRTPSAYEWADERSRLTAEPMRYAVALRPRWIALEQVPPVLPIWRYLAGRLRELGYRTWCGILSAEEHGVPQTRKRAILVASLDGPVGPPEPTHQAYRAGQELQTEPDLFGDPLPPPVSMAEALGWGLDARPSWTASGGGTDTGGAEVFANAKNREYLRDVVQRSNYSAGSSGGGTAEDRGRTSRAVDEPATTVTSKGFQWALRNSNQENSCEREPHEPAGTIYCSRIGNLRWMAPAGAASAMVDPRPDSDPAHTITGKGTAAWVQDRPSTTVCGDARIGHKDRDEGEAQFERDSVRVSVQEAGVLQSFPADYPWRGTKTAQYRQCGDAVPPLLATVILRPLLNATRSQI